MAKQPQAKTSQPAAAAPPPDSGIVVGKSDKFEVLDLKFGNRHGLVTGATGTGKTVTLQVIAEGFSGAGRPGLRRRRQGRPFGHRRAPARPSPPLSTATRPWALTYQPDEFPAMFWDVFGEQGHPIRATVSEMGPLLLSRILDLNDAQEGVLNIAFRVADEQGLALLDLKDLRAILQLCRRQRRRSAEGIRQRHRRHRRHHPAPAAGAGEPGRGQIHRRAGARTSPIS